MDEFEKVEKIINKAKEDLVTLTASMIKEMWDMGANEHAQVAALMTIYQEYHNELCKLIKQILPKMSEAAISFGLHGFPVSGEKH